MIKKIVYITGCLGFIGSYVTRSALKRGWYVMGVDKRTYASRNDLLDEFSAHENFSFIKSDINDLEYIHDCDYIINTAAETHVGNSIVKSDEFVKSNINGVHHLLELIRNYKVENGKMPIILHFSTDEVYGDTCEGSFSEGDLLKPSNPYSSTKAAADMLIKAWHRTYGIDYLIVRPTNNYGIGQYVEKLIPKTIKYLNLGRKVPLHNGGLPIRNWLHAEDTANAVIHIICNNFKNEIFNISGNFEDHNKSIVEQIIKLVKIGGSIEDHVDLSFSRKGQDVRYCVNDSKLRKTGWNNTKNFKDELPSIVEFYESKFIW